MKTNVLFTLTQVLSELLSSGLALSHACDSLLSMKEVDGKLRKVTSFIHEKLLQGISVSEAFLQCEILSVPQWYGGVLFAAEKSGSLHKAFSFLHETEKNRALSREKIISALAYPLFVMLLALSGTLFLVLTAPLYFPLASVDSFYSESFLSIVQALLFFIPSVFALCFWVFHTFSVDELFLSCNIILFLLSEKLSLLEALEYALCVCRNGSSVQKKLSNSLELLKEGFSAASSLENLHPAIGMYLRVAEETGRVDLAFAHLQNALSSAKKRKQEFCLSLLEPLLILIVGLYIAILIKEIFLPVLFAWNIYQ